MRQMTAKKTTFEESAVLQNEDKSLGALTKAELADALFDTLGLNKREAKDFIDVFFEELRKSLETGNSVKLSGFGNFQLRDKSERPGRNPKTGQEIPIAARRVVTFHASQKLKQTVAEGFLNTELNKDLR